LKILLKFLNILLLITLKIGRPPDHKSCLEHSSNPPEYYYTIINSIINNEDYDMADSPNNNTYQSDIKMIDITSNPLRKRPRSPSIPDFF